MKQNKFYSGFIYGLFFALFLAIVFNQYLAVRILNNVLGSTAKALELTGDPSIDAQILVFTKGAPRIYGEELGLAYEFDIRDQKIMNYMIKKMETFDRGRKKITLDDNEKKRYVNIGSKISCEFCCGAKSIIFNNGKAACGCAHSAAMRGLAKYLLKNHPNEFSDDEILRELARWKALYFPKQMMKKYASQAKKNKYTPDIAALMLGAKVTGKKGKNIPLPTSIENLPDMAGGC